MMSIRMPAGHRAIVPLAVLVLLTAAVLWSARYAVNLPPPQIIRPPGGQGHAVVFADVDDTGAVVARVSAAGSFLRAYHANGVSAWTSALPPAQNLAGCTHCPTAILDIGARLATFDGGNLNPLPAPPGASGVTPVAGRSGLSWTSRTGRSGLLLSLVPAATPFARFQMDASAVQSAWFAAAANTDAASAVSELDDVLDVARLRLAIGVPGRQIASGVFFVGLSSEPPISRACIAPSGARAAAVASTAIRTVIARLSAGGRLRVSQFGAGGTASDVGCSISRHGLLAWRVDQAGASFRLIALWPSGARTDRRLDGDYLLAAACPNGDRLVTLDSRGATVETPTRTTRYRGAVDAGCTASGVPWVLKPDGVVQRLSP